jgi:ABC-2 type transport system ATP-binding protein
MVNDQTENVSKSDALIEVSNLSYLYSNFHALKDVSFRIPRRGITALVGPNGAGKSTLLRCMAGLGKPDNGQININGIDVINEPREAHKYISYLSDNFGLYENLSVEETLEYFAGCHSISVEETAIRIENISKLLRISHKLPEKCSSLSRGWRQRVGIAIAIINKPKVLLLDEPASGLDPESRSELSTVLKALNKEDMQIIVSSHILSELEDYCDSMLVLRNGEIKEHITLDSHNIDETISAVFTFAQALTQNEVNLVQTLIQSPVSINSTNMEVLCSVPNDPFKQHSLLKALIENSLLVNSLRIDSHSLEKLYLDIALKE